MSPRVKPPIIIGCDESGVGDYLTPLVAAAVYIEPKMYNEVDQLGVRDSKTLTDAQISRLFELLSPRVRWSVRAMSQPQYNELTSEKKLNAHELKTLLYLKALASFDEARAPLKVPVLIDAYASLANFNKYVAHLKEVEDVPDLTRVVTLEEKADGKYLAVAAASIMARGYLLRLMAEQAKVWHMVFPLGVNDSVIDTAIRFVEINGKEKLGNVAKLSFKTTAKVLKGAQN